MQIGSMLRSLLGDVKATDPKAIELKVGQIVRGVLLQMLSEQEGLLQMDGGVVRARLETPIAKGQAAWLQVQQPSANGDVMLKPVPNPAHGLAELPLKEWAKEFGLKSHEPLLQAGKLFQDEGLPLAKEQFRAFLPALRAMPVQPQAAAQWLESAMTAMRKDIPLQADNIAFIRQALFGKPVHEQMQQLAAAIRTAPALPPAAQGMLEQLASRLAQLLAASRPATSAAPAAQSPASGTPGSAASAQAPPPPAASAPAAATGAPAAASPAAAQAPPSAATPPPAVPPAAANATGAAPAAPANAQAGAGAPPAPQAPPPALGAFAAAAATPAADSDAPATAAGQAAPPPAAAPDQPAPPAQAAKGDWIPQLLKAIGLDHEQQIQHALARRDAPEPLPQQQAIASDGAARAVELESLKSLLLQASRSEDVPASVKEPIQQLLQTITGQQLVNMQDRGSMFTQFTLFLPIQNGEGEQTATIHIQSRKHGKQLDSSNCRLLFDLDLSLIGRTVLDVQVVDRMVNLHVHNGEEWVHALVSSARPELEQALQQTGYRLIAMKCSVFDGPRFQESQESAIKMTQELRYKGVDIRV